MIKYDHMSQFLKGDYLQKSSCLGKTLSYTISFYQILVVNSIFMIIKEIYFELFLIIININSKTKIFVSILLHYC